MLVIASALLLTSAGVGAARLNRAQTARTLVSLLQIGTLSSPAGSDALVYQNAVHGTTESVVIRRPGHGVVRRVELQPQDEVSASFKAASKITFLIRSGDEAFQTYARIAVTRPTARTGEHLQVKVLTRQ
jgi:hypothetical protein